MSPSLIQSSAARYRSSLWKSASDKADLTCICQAVWWRAAGRRRGGRRGRGRPDKTLLSQVLRVAANESHALLSLSLCAANFDRVWILNGFQFPGNVISYSQICEITQEELANTSWSLPEGSRLRSSLLIKVASSSWAGRIRAVYWIWREADEGGIPGYDGPQPPDVFTDLAIFFSRVFFLSQVIYSIKS